MLQLTNEQQQSLHMIRTVPKIERLLSLVVSEIEGSASRVYMDYNAKPYLADSRWLVFSCNSKIECGIVLPRFDGLLALTIIKNIKQLNEWILTLKWRVDPVCEYTVTDRFYKNIFRIGLVYGG